MRSALHNLALLHDTNDICILDGRETMCNTDDSLVACFDELIDSLLNEVFTLGVKGRSGLIEQQELRLSNQGSGDGDSLFLSTGELYTSLTNKCIETFWELRFVLNEIETVCLLASFLKLCLSNLISGQAVANVVLDAGREEDRLL